MARQSRRGGSNGTGARIRTRIHGFGDRCSTVELHPYWYRLAELNRRNMVHSHAPIHSAKSAYLAACLRIELSFKASKALVVPDSGKLARPAGAAPASDG